VLKPPLYRVFAIGRRADLYLLSPLTFVWIIFLHIYHYGSFTAVDSSGENGPDSDLLISLARILQTQVNQSCLTDRPARERN
jgi:hypothetical protein